MEYVLSAALYRPAYIGDLHPWGRPWLPTWALSDTGDRL